MYFYNFIIVEKNIIADLHNFHKKRLRQLCNCRCIFALPDVQRCTRTRSFICVGYGRVWLHVYLLVSIGYPLDLEICVLSWFMCVFFLPCSRIIQLLSTQLWFYLRSYSCWSCWSCSRSTTKSFTLYEYDTIVMVVAFIFLLKLSIVIRMLVLRHHLRCTNTISLQW